MLLLTSGCSEKRPEFFVPPDDDGGQKRGDAGQARGDGGVSKGIVGSAGMSGMDEPSKPEGPSGAPADFDPDQVYLVGSFKGEVEHRFCQLLSPMLYFGVIDWSSPKNNYSSAAHITIGIPCRYEDLRIRPLVHDLAFEHADQAVRLFGKDEPTNTDGVITHADDLMGNDPEVALCDTGDHEFTYWFHPQTARIAGVCPNQRDPDAHGALVHKWYPEAEVINMPKGYTIVFLGYGDNILVGKDNGDPQYGILSGSDLIDVDLDGLPASAVRYIRAKEEGFQMLVLEDLDAAPKVFMLTYDGQVKQQGQYPKFGAQVIDTCPKDNGQHSGFKKLGCSCALDGKGAALCVATTIPFDPVTDADKEPDWLPGGIVVRSVAGEAKSTVVLTLKDNPLLDGYYVNLFSGI